MKSTRKTKTIILTILLSIAIIISVYSISAHCVASFVHEYEGVLIWPTPGYTFFSVANYPNGAYDSSYLAVEPNGRAILQIHYSNRIINCAYSLIMDYFYLAPSTT